MKNRQRFVRAVALFLAGLMLFSLVFAAIGSIASATYDDALGKLEDEKEAIRNDKIEAGNKAASLREQKAAWVQQKEALDEKNRLAQEEILNTQKQIEIYNEMIAEKQKEADAAQAAADEQLALYKKRLRSMEENGQFNTYMNVLLGAKSFDDLLSRVDVLTEIMENDKRLEQRYKDTRDEAIRVKAEYEQLNAELEAKKAELEEEVEQLKKEIAEADEMIAEIQKDIDKYTALYNAAAASEAAVMNKINNILAEIAAAEEAARKEAEEAAKREEEEKNNQTQVGDGVTDNGSTGEGGEGSGVTDDGNNGGEQTPPSAPPANNSPATGSYVWPTPNSRLITSLYGNRMHPILGYERYHSGVDINGSVGDPVVAADGGTVILSSYDPGGYGNYVVINHGNGRTTLYAHMSSVAVSVGNVVSQGQTIAYVGSTGLSTGPHLHFEIAVNGNRHDPLSYLGGYTIWEKAY
ncbi:MAG: peptidoglycan DD-metalloendopeptidase family protein [Oscillospiraceae bacterium]|nr:peptidoglycan DD-metalloendopeptidase family protein [Oscillospiraceae bacterium]